MDKVTRIGLILPHTDTTLEYDLQRKLPAHCVIHTERMWLDDVSIQAERKMLVHELPRAVSYLQALNLDLVIFGCTSASAINGTVGERQLVQKISQKVNCPVISAYGAVLSSLNESKGDKIAVITPYVKRVTKRVVNSLRENGLSISTSIGMGIKHDLETGRLTPSEIIQFIMKHQAQIANSDTLFISCTNLRALECQAALSAEYDLNVLTSNSAILSKVLERLR